MRLRPLMRPIPLSNPPSSRLMHTGLADNGDAINLMQGYALRDHVGVDLCNEQQRLSQNHLSLRPDP